jgi:hypothetical protein
MRYVVLCKFCGKKFYINTDAKVRSELPPSFTLLCPSCGYSATYSSFDVTEESSRNTTAGALIGGLLGLAAGDVGVVLGAAIGTDFNKHDY